ncbi:MAG TPA: hypothetical protein VN666_08135 [Nitrospira sp.]|nr:hypothetical protein [Nitrospira sp.]
MKKIVASSRLWCVVLLWAFVAIVSLANADETMITLDPALKGYIKVSGVSGNVTSIGSDTYSSDDWRTKAGRTAHVQIIMAHRFAIKMK